MRAIWKALNSDAFGALFGLTLIFGPFLGLSIAEFPEGGLRDILLRATWIIVLGVIGLGLVMILRDVLLQRRHGGGSTRRPGSSP
jgi:hypothetical protein